MSDYFQTGDLVEVIGPLTLDNGLVIADGALGRVRDTSPNDIVCVETNATPWGLLQLRACRFRRAPPEAVFVRDDAKTQAYLNTLCAAQTEYPECEKLAAAGETRRVLHDFLEWCAEKGLTLAQPCTGWQGQEGYWTPYLPPRDQLILQYLEVDYDRLEEERRAILEAQRQLDEVRHGAP